MVVQYFGLGRKLMGEAKAAPQKLHELRLASKQLRYTLELFRACYGPGLDTRMAELREVQRLLGEVADCAAAERAMGKPVRSQVKQFLQKRADGKTAEFRKYWLGQFDAAGRERWWTSYLQRNARAASRK